jgi:hypothetical protein
MKLLMKNESAAQKVLFGNAVLAALMSGRKYDVIPNSVSIFILLFPV